MSRDSPDVTIIDACSSENNMLFAAVKLTSLTSGVPCLSVGNQGSSGPSEVSFLQRRAPNRTCRVSRRVRRLRTKGSVTINGGFYAMQRP